MNNEIKVVGNDFEVLYEPKWFYIDPKWPLQYQLKDPRKEIKLFEELGNDLTVLYIISGYQT